MVLLEHLSDVDIARNHVASLRSEPSAVVISGDAPCVTLTTEPLARRARAVSGCLGLRTLRGILGTDAGRTFSPKPATHMQHSRSHAGQSRRASPFRAESRHPANDRVLPAGNRLPQIYMTKDIYPPTQRCP